MATYETITDGQRCPLHDVQFATGNECPRCVAVRAASAITVVDAPDSVALDAEMLKDIEADLSYSKFLHRIARDRLENNHPNEWRACSSVIAEATKLKYRALDQKDKLSARAHSRYLVEHEKGIKGLAKRKGS